MPCGGSILSHRNWTESGTPTVAWHRVEPYHATPLGGKRVGLTPYRIFIINLAHEISVRVGMLWVSVLRRVTRSTRSSRKQRLVWLPGIRFAFVRAVINTSQGVFHIHAVNVAFPRMARHLASRYVPTRVFTPRARVVAVWYILLT